MSEKRFNIDWPRTIAGGLAAVVAAIVLSKLGAVGTLTGAALGSILVSVFTNIGAHGIQSTSDRMMEAQKEAARRVAHAQAEVQRAREVVADASEASRGSEDRLHEAEAALAASQSELAQDVPTDVVPAVNDATRILPAVVEPTPKRTIRWRRALIFAAASFVLAVALITAFELVGGRPLSSYTGGGGHGTSVTDWGGGSGSTPTPTPSPTPTPTESPTPTPSPTPSPSATPTEVATPTPTASPTDGATPTDGASGGAVATPAP